jgi:hypothetical protein
MIEKLSKLSISAQFLIDIIHDYCSDIFLYFKRFFFLSIYIYSFFNYCLYECIDGVKMKTV